MNYLQLYPLPKHPLPKRDGVVIPPPSPPPANLGPPPTYNSLLRERQQQPQPQPHCNNCPDTPRPTATETSSTQHVQPISPPPPTIEKSDRVRKRKPAKDGIIKIAKKDSPGASSDLADPDSDQDPPLVIDLKSPDDFALTNNDIDEEEAASLLAFNPGTA